MDRRLRQNGVVLFFSLIAFLSIWQIITGPGPPLSQVKPTAENDPVIAALNNNFTHPTHLLNTSDYNQLMNINNFTFTIFNSVCNETYPFLLILIHSAPQNFEKRRVIRETWGSSVDNVKLIFMLGLVQNEALQKTLEKENETYGDFVQGTFIDSYKNVTYKHAMVFKYMIYHCPHAKYLLKTDDDVFINIFTMYDFLFDLSPYGVSNFMYCEKHFKSRVLRSYRSKWRVPYNEYPHRYYPPYCPGWSIIYSSDLVFKLYKELQNSSYFWIDDVLVTGIIFQELNLPHTPQTIELLTPDEQYEILNGNLTTEMRPFLWGRGEMTSDEIKKMWEYCRKYMRRKRQSINQNHSTRSP